MCDNKGECCDQLEAEALYTNDQLLQFDVRSKDVNWHDFVTPKRERTAPVYLQRQFNLLSSYREPIGNHNRRRLLVCHDMMGNYMEDRYYHSSKKYDDYRFYHWSAVDYFCYFSHNYITIPPCGWINAAHKHGVAVLGTFITESGHSGLLQEVLQSTEMVNKIVNAMVKLCKHYHFEGWLVNIECKVNPESMENLYYFVSRLRQVVQEEIDSGIVFWYDSIIKSGQLLWQNELNDKNVKFLKSANAMLVNYTWNDNNLERTRSKCDELQTPLQNVFFGLDVFGRNQIAKFHSKLSLARIVKQRFSTGIFAPGWTFETLQNYGYNIKLAEGDDVVNNAFLLRNEKFWWLLWEHLATHPYSEMPFYTDFCMGSGKMTYMCGLPRTTTEDGDPVEDKFFNLSRQSLQPSVPLHNLATRNYNDAFNGGSCLSITQFDTSFRLFATDFKFSNAGLVFAYAYKLNPRDGEFDCILRFCTGNNSRDCYLFLGDYYDKLSLQRGRCYVSPFKPQFNDLLDCSLECPQIPKDMAFPDFQANGWRVRYYVVEFDGPIQVKDIGVLYRKTPGAIDTAYLGAVYLNEFDVNRYDFPTDSNISLIMAYGGDLLN